MVGSRVLILAGLLFVMAARVAVAQAPDTGSHPSGTTITGIVRDSIAQMPLSGATVQLVGVDKLSRVARTTTSDSLGRFTLRGVPAGRYSIGFFHPALEVLGIEPPIRELFVLGQGEVRSDLATPSAERYREAVCGVAEGPEPGAVVVGVVRDARDFSAVPGVQVTGEWMELTLSKKGVVRKTPRIVATTAQNGWFAMCDVPSPGTMVLRATRDSDSIELVEVQLPARGVVRNELFLGRAGPASDVHPEKDAARRQPAKTGDGLLSGVVLSAEDGRPLPGARVHILAGPQTRANERGEWMIRDAPTGTRMLEIQSIGYYPDRRAVNVVPDAPPIRVKLSTLKAVLAAIRVSANRIQFDHGGFEERHRTAAGKYLTADDIERIGARVPSDLFKMMPGFKMEADDLVGAKKLWMRGPYGYCEPTIFIDGNRMPGLTADDIDDLFRTKEVAGIEIYSEASAPAQFREYTRMDVCGSIVIWRK